MSKNTDIQSEIQNIEVEKQILEEKVDKDIERFNDSDDVTRQQLARRFVLWYFSILLIILIGIPIYNLVATKYFDCSSLAITLKDMVLTYSAVVGPTLGLVIAYYFKSRGD